MRVMIVNVHFAPESFGGATLVAEETAHRLRAAGHEVVVVTGSHDERIPPGQFRRYSIDGVPVIAVRHMCDGSVANQYDNPWATQAFERILAATRPDVVHFHAIQMLGVGVVEAAQEAGIPTVVTAHDAWWLCERQFMVRSNGRYCGQTAIDPDVCATCVPDALSHRIRQQRSMQILSGCDRVLVPSEFWRGVMVGSGVPSSLVHVNANGVSRPPAGWERPVRVGPVRLGYVGGVNDVKGYPQIVAALQHLKRSDYELKVVDAMANLGVVGFNQDAWPVPGYVNIVPGYDRDGLDEFFGSVDVLLFPSQWKESYGLTVREAMLRGVWPIVTDGGGTVENIVDGRSGTIIPLDGDHLPLAEAVRNVLDHPEDFIPDLGEDEAGILTLDDQGHDLERHLREVLQARGSQADL